MRGYAPCLSDRGVHESQIASANVASTHPCDVAVKRVRPDRITGTRYLERGKVVTVLIRWNGKGPRNVLVEREDGSRVIRPFRGLRKIIVR